MIIQFDRTLQSADIQQEFGMSKMEANTFLRRYGVKINSAKKARWVISQHKLTIMKLDGTIMEYMKEMGRKYVYGEKMGGEDG